MWSEIQRSSEKKGERGIDGTTREIPQAPCSTFVCLNTSLHYEMMNGWWVMKSKLTLPAASAQQRSITMQTALLRFRDYIEGFLHPRTQKTGNVSAQNQRNASFITKTRFHWPSIKLFGGNVKAIASDLLLPGIHNFVPIFGFFHLNRDSRRNDKGVLRRSTHYRWGFPVGHMCHFSEAAQKARLGVSGSTPPKEPFGPDTFLAPNQAM